MKKRVLSMFMALALCLTLLPVSPAWAKEADAQTQTGTSGTVYTVDADTAVQSVENDVVVQAEGSAVADVDGTAYTDLIAAFDAAQEKPSATVKLLADVATNGLSSRTHRGTGTGAGAGNYIFEQGNVTFDLNGHTLTWTKYDVYSTSLVVGDNGRLTIRDSGTGGKIYNEETQALQIYAGTLNIQRGTVVSESNKALKIIGGDVSITGGTIHSGDYFGEGVSISPDTVNNRAATLTISGGAELKGGTNGSGLYVDHVGDENPLVKLSGGTYTGGSSGINCYNTTVGTLLDENCRYMLSGSEVTDTGVAALGSGVTVEADPNAPVKYIDADGNEARANCTEITAETWDISQGWHVVKENVTISGLNISGEVNLILCDGATLTVTSFMNVSAGSTLNLFWQSAGSGKLTAADISVLGTVTAPAGEMKQTNDSSGTTFEKCFEHDWEYTNNGDTHTATCKLCGKDGGAVNHSYTDWTDNSDGTHTGKCVCEATAKENHTPTYTPNADGLTHSTKCSKCGYAAAAESHNFDQTDKYGKKCACGAYLAAEYNGQQYATLARAIEAAKNGGTVTLQMDVGERITVNDGMNVTIDLNNNGWTTDGNTAHATLVVTGGSVTVQNGRLTSGTSSNAYTAVEVEGGKLTVGEDMTIQGGSMDADRQFPAIDVKGGELVLSVGAKLDGGMKVSVEGKQLKDYLPEGTAFQQTAYDQQDTTEPAEIINGYVQEYVGKFTLTVVPHPTHDMKGGACACGFTCAHETVENGVCTVCKQQMKAKASASDGTEKYYLELQEAFEGVADGGTVTMLTTLTDDDTISFCCDAEGKPVEKTVTLMMNGQSLSFEGASPLHIQSGKLIIGDEAAISQPAQAAVPAVFVDNDEQSKDRGTLEFKGKANLTGGLLIQNWGKLVGGLKEGTIITSNGTYSVSVERSIDTYGNVLGLLGDGLAFAKYDASAENKAGALVDGSVNQLTEDVIVVAHTTHTVGKDNKCACGFSCTHTNTEGASTIGEDGKCTLCGTQFAAGIGEIYYTDVKSALDAAADGQTVRLLANGMLPYGIYASKTLTLDLNGHSLSGYSLNVGGLTATSQVRTGNLTVIDSSGGNGAVGVTVRDGGTLVFDPENDSTTLLQLEVWGGTVELYGGKISRQGLRLNNSITLGNLLPQNAGLAYYCGDTQLTLEEAASKTCDLVVKSCAHGGKNGFDENAATCPNCNAPAVAETALNNGEGNRLRRRFADLQTALDADRDGGATLQLLADVTGEYTIDGTRDTGFDLNGYCIKGTVTVKAATGNNTTTFSNTQNTTTANIDAVVAHKGAKLAGSRYPAVIGELTLAEGATWKNILNLKTLGYKVLNGGGTYQWYAPEDVNGSQLNNVIINSLPITSKTLNLKVNGKNLTGNPPKVERGTTVQLCASCNTKDADVAIYVGEIVGNNNPTYSQKKAEYKKIGTNWYYVVDLDANTIGTYDIYFTASKDGYSVTSSHKKLTVTKADIPASAITAPAANALTYNGNKQELVTAGSVNANYGEMQYRLGTSGGFSTAIPTATDAGTYTVWYRVIGDANHNNTAPASVVVSIGKKPLTITGVTAVSKPYDGTTNADITSVTFDNVTLNRGTDYNVTASFDDASVGSGKNITATVTLMEQTAKNYALEQSSFPTTGSITKAAAPDFTRETALVIVNDCEKTYTVTLPALPELETPKEYGAPTYKLGEIKLNGGYYTGGAKVENGKLTLPIQKNDVETTGSVGTVTVVIKSTNYENITLTVNVSAKNKLTPVLAGTLTLTPTKITYGEPLSKIKITGTMQDPITGDEVNGTFAWKDDTIKPAANDSYEAEWIFTPAEGYEEYATVTDIVKVPVAPKSIEGATITLEKYEFAYNAAEQSPKITGITLDNWDETRITYIIKSGDKATDVSDRITLTIEGIGNYTGTATVEWKITPKTVTPTIKVASCTYTGDALEPTVTLKDGAVVIPEGEYTVEYSNNTNAGTGRVTVKDVEGGNYVLNEASKTFEITKAAAPAAETGSLIITNGLHETYSLDLSTLLPKLTAPCDYGAIIYDKKVDTHLGVGTFITLVNGKTGELTLEANRSGTDEGQFGTITVTISTSNYQDITLTIHVSAKNKLTPVLAGTLTLTPTEITYGEPLSKIKITGTMKAGDTVVEGTFAWQQPGDTILDASTSGHDVGWKFTPKDGNTYTEATGTATVKVDKAQQYGKVSMAGYTYGQAPSTPTLTDRTGDLNAQVTYGYAAAGSGSVQTWDIQNPPALNAGTYRMYASIGDTDNYYGFEAVYCEFVVAKATPAYTAPTGLTAKYGQTLADVKLPDGWSWMNSSESVGDASTVTKTFQARFTPTDTDNYNMVENIELEVMVNKEDSGNLKTVELEQKYTDASEHTYTPDWSGLPSGQTWRYSSEYSVSTGSNVTLTKQDFVADGSLLTYAVSGGKAGDKITLTLKASCDNYGDFTITLNITLTEKDDQKPLTITGDISVIYGEKLTLTTTGGSGMGAVTYRIDTAYSTGEATIDPNTGVLTPVKVGSVSVIATKAGDNNYNDVTSAPFVLMIKPATSTGEPKYTKITTSGKTLKDAALTTEGSTLKPNGGKLEWVDDKDNVLSGDTKVEANTTYKWRFTPTDTNYTTLTGEIELYRKSSSGGGGWYYSYYTIKATAGTGGSISPSGNVSVREGGDQTFTITPDKGYAVANVKIDGKRIGAVKSYTFKNVRRTHTIEVIFVKGSASASTGDSSNLPLWSALLLASTLTLAGAVHYKRKRAR